MKDHCKKFIFYGKIKNWKFYTLNVHSNIMTEMFKVNLFPYFCRQNNLSFLVSFDILGAYHLSEKSGNFSFEVKWSGNFRKIFLEIVGNL